MFAQPTAPKTDDAPQVKTTGPVAPGRPMEERRIVAWVGKSVVFKGDLSSAEDLTIDGQVEGTINVPEHGVNIGPDADIRADIVSKIVIVRGRVKGTITASDKIHLHDTASVEGACKAPRFVIADGAWVVGRLETPKRPTASTGS
jgi:cytoskeletal protein CcmA (bactofilin family)